jgi:Kef-type K+ transport system membrane component KefB
MQVSLGNPIVITIGWLLALLILILALVFLATSQIPLVLGALIAGVALSRLL